MLTALIYNILSVSINITVTYTSKCCPKDFTSKCTSVSMNWGKKGLAYQRERRA